ncbi:MAG: acetyl-CoA C-acyltransferase, partial [Vicinamibacteraceae bacterium]|nr:acetyl-CoA C-acyltransferase [Vicinamibacteraceae bacterium]
MPTRVYIVGGVRTPMGSFVGPLKDLSANELGALAAKAALERTGVRPEQIEQVVFGNVVQTSADAIYCARHIGLKAGIPVEVPALTVNRLCGSGIESAVVAGHLIQLGEAHLALVGGTESMSQAPHVVRGARTGLRLGQGRLEDMLWEALTDSYCGCPMAITAENCAAHYGISREAQDEYALRSQQRAASAWDEGRLAEEVVPVQVRGRKGPETFARDDHMRPDATLEGLAKLPPVFKKDGGVTAGNASGIVDGAAALVLASSHAVEGSGLRPWGSLVASVSVGVEPSMMGMGPAPAIRALLRKTGLTLDDIDLFEINEAFAAQYLAVEKELGLDRDKVNVNGGAIALGHPLGMSGTRLLLTLLLEMRRRGAQRGIAA